MTPEQREVIFEKARGRYAFDSLAEEAIREAIRLTEEAVREEYVDADSLADDKLTEVIEEAYAKGRKDARASAFSEGYDKGASEEWSVLEKRARADERAKCEAHSKDDVEAARKEEREKYEAVLAVMGWRSLALDELLLAAKPMMHMICDEDAQWVDNKKLHLVLDKAAFKLKEAMEAAESAGGSGEQVVTMPEWYRKAYPPSSELPVQNLGHPPAPANVHQADGLLTQSIETLANEYRRGKPSMSQETFFAIKDLVLLLRSRDARVVKECPNCKWMKETYGKGHEDCSLCDYIINSHAPPLSEEEIKEANT